jgi:peptidyl-prolyl cis-trans isomerase C
MKLSYGGLVKEPLLQFLVIGLILFGGERLLNADDYADSHYKILVDDEVLIQFLQQRAKQYKPEQAIQVLAAMDSAELALLTDDYVRGEVLYREAVALDLDRDDPIIRRRLMQKMDYLAQGFYDEIEPLTEDDLTAFYKVNREDYRKPASATFTHVFVSSEKRGSEESKVRAESLLTAINQIRVPFEKAGLHGERFLYNRNYVNRDSQEIASHFGRSFEQQLFALNPVLSDTEAQWQGPLLSNYGWHLVLLTKNIESFVPTLIEISGIVLADAQRQQQDELKRVAVDTLRAKYTVTKRAYKN